MRSPYRSPSGPLTSTAASRRAPAEQGLYRSMVLTWGHLGAAWSVWRSMVSRGGAHDTAARSGNRRQPGGSGHNERCPASWPILGCSAALLAGAVVLVLAGEASVAFLVTFVSCTAILLLLVAESGHGLLAMTVRRGLAKLREPRPLRAQPGLHGAAADPPSAGHRARARADSAPYLTEPVLAAASGQSATWLAATVSELIS